MRRFRWNRQGVCLVLTASVLLLAASAVSSAEQSGWVRSRPSPAVAAVSQTRVASPKPSPSPTPAPTAAPTPAPPPTPTPSPSPLAGLAPPVMVQNPPWSGPGAIPILMYHYVNSRPPPDELDWNLTITEADFTRQMSYLRCAGYYSITLSQLYDAIYTGSPLPEKPIILTFDDGYRDAYTSAFPLLRSAGFGGTFAVVTDWVGHPDYMNWDQLREMTAAGMEVASHSVSHPDLGRQPDDVVRDQLGRSKQVLEQQLGLPVPFFIYPAGEPFRFGTAERQAQVATMVQEAGYRGALTARANMWQDPSAPFALNRVRVSGGTDIYKFAERMWGPHPDSIAC